MAVLDVGGFRRIARFGLLLFDVQSELLMEGEEVHSQQRKLCVYMEVF